MANSYRALAVLLSYPTSDTVALMPAVAAALEGERLVPAPLLRELMPLLDELSAVDLYDSQSRYVDLFDRTRSLSLQLYEHVHGESRDRGQAMVELLKLYSSRGLELTAKELPDHLPVFWNSFPSNLPMKLQCCSERPRTFWRRCASGLRSVSPCTRMCSMLFSRLLTPSVTARRSRR